MVVKITGSLNYIEVSNGSTNGTFVYACDGADYIPCKLDLEQLVQLIDALQDERRRLLIAKAPKLGQTYTNIKRGTDYVVKEITHCSTTTEPYVLYQSVSTGRNWHRPIEEFLSKFVLKS